VWLQAEPLLYLGLTNGELGAPRRYGGVYAAGNPVGMTDPDGYVPQLLLGLLVVSEVVGTAYDVGALIGDIGQVWAAPGDPGARQQLAENTMWTAAGIVIPGAGGRATKAAVSAAGDVVGDVAAAVRRGDGAAGRASTAVEKVGAVIEETATGAGNFTSGQRLGPDEALDAGAAWVGEGYAEVGPSGSGVFRSADGRRQFRMTDADLDGAHGAIGSHVHLERLDPERSGKMAIEANNHIPLDGQP
jgi:hypothetical protein